MFKQIDPFKYNIEAYGSDNCNNNNKDFEATICLPRNQKCQRICQELDEVEEKKQTNKQNERRSSTHTKRKTAKNERNAQMGLWMKELRGLDTLIY